MQISAYPHAPAVDVFKAVADPTRLRILGLLLANQELCVCEVVETLDIAQPRASRQLSTLRRAGLVVDRRDGAWAYYSIPGELPPLVRAVVDALRVELDADPMVREDRARFRKGCCS